MKILITILILIATNSAFSSEKTIIEYDENIAQADYVCQQEKMETILQILMVI